MLNYFEKRRANILEEIKKIDPLNPNWLSNFEAEVGSTPDTRTEVIWILKDLVAKGEYIKESLEISELYSHDTDPTPERDDLNEKVSKGEDIRNIYTVRGSLPWLLQMIGASLHTEYYPQTIDIIERLATDPVFYVRGQATVGLSIFAANVIAKENKDGSPFNFTDKDRARVHALAFRMLRENKDLPRVLEHVVNVFNRMRFLSEAESKEMLNTFFYKNEKELNPDYLLEHVAPLALYYAEYRTKDDEAFKNEYFQEFLQRLILDSGEQSPRLKSTLIWHTWREIQSDSKNYEILKKYIPLFLEGKYDGDPIGQFDFLVIEIIKIDPIAGIDFFEKLLKFILDGMQDGSKQVWLTSISDTVNMIAEISPKNLPTIFTLLEKIFQNQNFVGDIYSIFSSYKNISSDNDLRNHLEKVAKDTYGRLRSKSDFNLPQTLD